MESARPVLPKAPSPTTLSVASKDEQKPVPVEQSVDIKDAEIANDTKPVIADKNAVKSTDPSVATPESASVKELTSQESAPVHEELQEKLSAGDQGSSSSTWFTISILAANLFSFIIYFHIKVLGLMDK